MIAKDLVNKDATANAEWDALLENYREIKELEVIFRILFHLLYTCQHLHLNL